MNNFDIKQFYIQHNIDFVERGVNVKHGEINISCPFCNSSDNPDPSNHLGVDPETGYFSCWRNSRHRGRRLHRLLMKLTGMSYRQVVQLLGDELVWLKEGAWAEFLFGKEETEEETKVKSLKMPAEFVQFVLNHRAATPYVKYLIGRKFKSFSIEELTSFYDLRYCLTGRYAKRVVVPVYLDSRLMTWTGRSILPTNPIRYDTLSVAQGAPVSNKSLVYNFDSLIRTGGQLLFICEGPFDALKLDFYGKELNARATCLFGKSVSEEQACLLYELAEEFDYFVVMLDMNEFEGAWKILNSLSLLGDRIMIGELSKGVKDPGDLTRLGVRKLVSYFMDETDKRSNFSILNVA